MRLQKEKQHEEREREREERERQKRERDRKKAGKRAFNTVCPTHHCRPRSPLAASSVLFRLALQSVQVALLSLRWHGSFAAARLPSAIDRRKESGNDVWDQRENE